MICKWADDSQRLIMGYFDAIQNSPSEIYLHALSFCPHSSWLHEYYSSELPMVKVVKGFQTTWGVCSRTVSFDDPPETLAHWNDMVAVGFQSGQIIILDAVTGIQMSVLSGHTQLASALTFSLDGTYLVSGSNDNVIKLWDIQTGGVIRTFRATDYPSSISISVDNGTIACLYCNGRIGLWDADVGGLCVTTNYDQASSVIFSLTNPQLLLIVSMSGAVLQWNLDGPEPIPIHEDDVEWLWTRPSFSFDGTCWILPGGPAATVFNSDSGAVVARLKVPGPDSKPYGPWVISSNGKYAACSARHTIFVWDTTGSDPHLINTFIGHTSEITSITFSSSLISSSNDQSIKFWEIDASLTESVAADKGSTSFLPITISLQAKDDVAIVVDEAGVVRTWDLSTGLCRASFSTPVIPHSQRDIRLTDDRVIFVWCTTRRMHFWDSKRKKHHQTMDSISYFSTTRLRISGDGSKVFVLDHEYIHVLSTQKAKIIGKVRLEGELSDDPLIVDGSRVWVHFKDSQTQGWNFGVMGTAPLPSSDTPPDPPRPHLDFISCARTGSHRVEDTVTGKNVYQLMGRFASPIITQWDGRYLVAGYGSGEVLILDFNHMTSQ